MPPERAAATKTKKEKSPKQDHSAVEEEEKVMTKESSNKKRKTDNSAAGDGQISSKSQRRSGRGGSSKAAPEQLLNFLLSKEAEQLTRPEDEIEDIKERGDIKTYSSTALNPFEELMCAIVLSRPISHRLGLRTIRTLLNDPYNFTSAKALREAGSDKQHQALWDARTQHKDKTAQQLGQLADVVLDKFTAKGDTDGKELGKALDDSEGDLEKLRAALRSPIKGLGPTGLDIFFRRIQWLWDNIYPYVDGRTVDSLRRFDLPYDPEGLGELIEQNWKQLDTKHLSADNDAQKKRRAFVLILERVTGADLEGKIETMLSHATK